MTIELLIQNGSKVYIPMVQDGVTWQTDRKGSPGELRFSVVLDGGLDVTEGNAVRLKVDGNRVFYGFIFSKKRNKDGILSITAYDQLRYLKNKDTYIYTNKTADEFVRMIASDFQMQTGVLEHTGYKIFSRVEENTTLLDMIQNALDLTLQNKKEMYVLYDDFGKISLKNISSMVLNLMIHEQTGENFDYSSSIDSDSYNRVKLVYEDDKRSGRLVQIAQDDAHVAEWGVLQYFDSWKNGENGKAKAEALLQLYNKKTRTLSISNAFGDVRVRAGCMVIVQLDLGDVKLRNLMLVEKCKHTFGNSRHLMDLTLKGGEFVV